VKLLYILDPGDSRRIITFKDPRLLANLFPLYQDMLSLSCKSPHLKLAKMFHCMCNCLSSHLLPSMQVYRRSGNWGKGFVILFEGNFLKYFELIFSLIIRKIYKFFELVFKIHQIIKI
jgi:hypothetical protein